MWKEAITAGPRRPPAGTLELQPDDPAALFVTERCVFRLTPQGLELVEVAPGIDVARDILARMDFVPLIAADLKSMDERLFAAGPMGNFDGR